MEKLTAPVLVGVRTQSDTEITAPAAVALRQAREITSGSVIAVCLEGEIAKKSCEENGADKLIIPAQPQSGLFTAQDAAAFLGEAVRHVESSQEIAAVLVPSTAWGKEVAAHVAAELSGAVVTDVTEIEIKDAHIEAGKTALGGTWSTRFMLTAGCPVLAVAPAAPVQESAGNGEACEVSAIPFTLEPKVKVVSRQEQDEDESAALADAQVAVIAGRGIDGDVESVQKLAQLLGGAVGATRVACDEEWLDRSVQVGQTGLTISPKIYLGLGVSGAIHHVCGIFGSSNIAAVCDDPDAPIFDIADFGIVGDVAEILPATIRELEEKLG